MRLRNPHLQDKFPTKICHLCGRPFCDDHKGKEDDVCEINHETYYRNHPELQEYLFRTYEDWLEENEKMMADEMSGDERKKE
jgi:hypothetical protein